MYCVYDRVTCMASAPFLQPNDEAAKRSFVKLMRETGCCGDDDYELIFLGTWDASSMQIDAADTYLVMVSSVIVKG